MDKKEMVEHPDHYNVGKIEVIDFIEAWNLNFSEGSVVKYVTRYKFKGKPVEDLKKARFYIDRLIKTAELADGSR
tara:strand:- start:660 stop:884 length:225 start_codon:yes stop_codon:yes gene_type:complete